jgi:hypothetical protein
MTDRRQSPADNAPKQRADTAKSELPNAPSAERRHWLIAVAFFAILAAVLTFTAFLPSRAPLPVDLPRDYAAWKPDPHTRFVISNKDLSDPICEYLSWDHEIRRRIAAGQLPWRNAFAGDGAHLFANPETALLTPLTWPRIVFGDRGWALTIFLKVFLGGLGMWWLAQVLTGCNWRSALMAGVAWATCGFFTVWLLFPHTNVCAVLPWLAAAVLWMLRTPSRRSCAAVVVTAALATAGGHPETIFYGVIAIGALLAWQWRDERWPIRRVLLCLGCAAAGFLLIGVQLVPFGVALRKSHMLAERAAEPHRSIRLFAIPAQVLPGYLGSPLAGEIDLSGIAEPAAENFNERSAGYAGAVALLVLLFAWSGLPRIARRAVVVGAVALLLSWNIPVIRSALHALPLFSVSANARLGFIFAFFAAASLGAALETVARGVPARREGTAIAIVAAVALAAALFVATPAARAPLTSAARSGIAALQHRNYLHQPPRVYEERLSRYLAGFQRVVLRRMAMPAACILAAGIALAITRRRTIVISISIAVEMIAFAYGYNAGPLRAETAPIPPAIADVRHLDPDHRFFIAAASEVYPPNLGSIHEVRDVRSYDVLQERLRIDTLRSAGYDPALRAFGDEPSAAVQRQLALLGVRYFLTRAAVPGAQRVGGSAPPAVGVYEMSGATAQPWPLDDPPPGIVAGAAISIVALFAAAALVMTVARTS